MQPEKDRNQTRPNRNTTGLSHCKTNGAGNSYPGLAVYVRHIVPLWLENHTMVIHLCEVCGTTFGWKIIHHFIHLCEVYCTVRV